MVDANKVERAADLVERLHNEVSFDLAIRIAGRHDKLADIVEQAKFNKFSPPDDEHALSDEEEYSNSPETTLLKRFEAPSSRNVSPDAGAAPNSKRDLSTGSTFFGAKKQRLVE